MTDATIKRRLRALFRLARDASATPAEAASALEKAHAIMLQHAIDSFDPDAEIAGKFEAHFSDGVHIDGVPGWAANLGAVVGHLYGVRTITFTDGVNFAGNSMEACFAADETLSFLLNQVFRFRNEAVRTIKPENGERFSESFCFGCTSIICDRIFEIISHAREKSDGRALIERPLDQVDKVVASTFGENKKGYQALEVRPDPLGLLAGQVAGTAVNIQRRVE